MDHDGTHIIDVCVNLGTCMYVDKAEDDNEKVDTTMIELALL